MPLLSGDRAAPHNPWRKTLGGLPDSSPGVHLLAEGLRSQPLRPFSLTSSTQLKPRGLEASSKSRVPARKKL